MDESTKRRWDVRLGVVTPIVTITGLLIGVWQFNMGEGHKAQFEHDSKIWGERLNAYRGIAELAGKIVARAGQPAGQEAMLDFVAAYWGTMVLVEDRGVEEAMVAFYTELEDYKTGWSSLDRLKIRADALIKSCRRSAETGAPKL